MPNPISYNQHDIRCVAFDAVGTLIFARPSVAEIYTEIGCRFGSRLSESDVGKRFRQAMTRFDNTSTAADDGTARFSTNEAQERTAWKEIVENVLDDVDDLDGCFGELFDHFARPTSWRCFDDVAATLGTLRRRGYEIAIASNFDDRLNSVCDGMQELESIGVRVISSQVGYRKPSRLFYERLLRETRCVPAQLLMVGDDDLSDISGAVAYGINAIQICRDQATRSQTPTQITSLTRLIDLLKERC